MNHTQKTAVRNKTIVAIFSLSLAVGYGISEAGSESLQAQPILPSPAAYVSSLDIECYRPENEAPPIDDTLILNHLNPVLLEMGIESEKAEVTELEEVCVPVMKNGVQPPDLARRFISYTDLACYQARSEEELGISLKLSHLNPVLQKMGFEDQEVYVARLAQLCTPVEKRGAAVPDRVARLVSQVDVACYDIEAKPVEASLKIDHLNPLLVDLPSHELRFGEAPQLCLPVAKDDRIPPDEILNIVQWVDLLKFRVDPSADVVPLQLTLRHLNPRFADYDRFDVSLPFPTTLGVPVAKNGVFPPKD